MQSLRQMKHRSNTIMCHSCNLQKQLYLGIAIAIPALKHEIPGQTKVIPGSLAGHTLKIPGLSRGRLATMPVL